MTAGVARRWRRLATIALVVVLFVPVIRGRDGVPLSRYPMYAAPRSATMTFAVARAFDADDNELTLSTRQLAGTGDPLIAESWLRTETRAGRAAAACAQVARRLADTTAVTVVIRSEIHDLDRRVDELPTLMSAETEATCAVG